MSDEFKNGYKFFEENASIYFAAEQSNDFINERLDYLNDIENEIEEFENLINSFKGFKTDNNILKGDVAEFWHSGSFNIDSAINKSLNRVNVDRSHDIGSVDISSNFGLEYGLKYYKSGSESAKAQAISNFERHKINESIGIEDNVDNFSALYFGQVRIIPHDQMNDAIKYLKLKIAKESTNRPEKVECYKETLKLLNDKILDSEGNKSIPLSEKEARQLAQIAKEGNFKASDFGFTVPNFLNTELFIKESFKAGMDAMILSIVLELGPEIYKVIDHLIKTGDLNENEIKTMGFKTISSAAKGFLRGSITAAIFSLSKSGALGEQSKAINSNIIGAIVVLTLNTLTSTFLLIKGEKTKKDITDEILKNMFLVIFSHIGKEIANKTLPQLGLIGTLVGSMVGSIFGEFTYNFVYKTTMSFCVESGITMFKIVEQNYELPLDVIDDMGLKRFEFEKFEFNNFEPISVNLDLMNFEKTILDNLSFTMLRRGVISIFKIGYV